MKNYTLLDRIKEELKQYANDVCSHYSFRQCFGERIGLDVAIARWIYEYFETELDWQNEAAKIQAECCLKYAKKNDLNLFNYLIANIWAEESFDYQDSHAMNDFLNNLIEQENLFGLSEKEKTEKAAKEYIASKLKK